jgi:hypothetical protein
MPSIIECNECGASNTELIEVCGICYNEVCVTMTKPILICTECNVEINEPFIDPGESLFT